MKKLTILVCLCVVALYGGMAHAQATCDLNEPGSLLVYPLIDNINARTIIEITNLSNTGVWVGGYMIVHGPGTPYDFVKKSFYIHLTQKEVVWWDTSKPYNRVNVDGQINQVQGFAHKKGFMFLYAIDSEKTQLELDWNFLKGDALVYTGGAAFQYNAIPHQMLAVAADRVLNLDGLEYCAGPSTIYVEGFAEDYVTGLGGKLVVANLDIDFVNSIQPAFDINLLCWNQNEVPQDRHVDFYQFEQYDITNDLQLKIDEIFTPKWWCGTTSTNPLWAIFYQQLGSRLWGGNVFQNPNTGTATAVILPPVPPQ
jgi:hypothetical protein